ncbi:zinc dependent phospholipase C family protein [Anaerofilum sp. BX8]|uniref:Zinc dependent phospholipase C family protein n=1 Tax=Anaerofilum hominis TaxID=2763016 RepID=A0A923IAU6_9FIRM|nr:zinc dependent phospholipase C family protein [Anaerofilum hominis]MBC5581458.1 zinc dependent phospholipase C family protein [Anaerofilum hominis]
MPDAYAHIRTARHALALSGVSLPSDVAFRAGANGPDPFFVYRFWESRPAADLPSLAQRLHAEQAGPFLAALARLAVTPAQQSYAAGFALHNALDSLAHPYVAFLTAEGAPYDIPQGHCYYEAALDTALWRRDGGRGLPPLDLVAPPLITAELGETAALLVRAVGEVYGAQLPFPAVVDAFSHFRLARWFFRSRFGVKKLAARGIDAALKKPHYALSHTQPRKLLPGLPQEWTDPFTDEEKTGGIDALLAAAEERGAGRLTALRRYWDGGLPLDDLARLLGSASYETGLPC